jgi:TetR/AcrR family transcriptional repressor of mexJK operon
MNSVNEVPDKRDEILIAAQRRLGIYGYEKTTMLEIAKDISMSKAALYYYYPDKQSIFKAVIEKEQHEFLGNIEIKMASIDDPEEMLLTYVGQRINYFKTFMNLSKFRNSMSNDIKPVLRETFLEFRKQEQKVLTQILLKGKEAGRFHTIDPEMDAKMFLDILKGLRFSLVQQQSFVGLNNEELDILENAIKYFTGHFIKGLKFNQ